MKNRKLVYGLVGLFAVSALVGCKKNASVDPDAEVDVDYQLAAAGELATGFVSLANQHANAPLKADGTYVAGGHTFHIKDTYKTTYAAEPNKDLFNYLTNQWTINSYHYCNMVDGLVENDKYGNIVGAIALGYKVVENDDGTESWTLQLRENAEWVDNKTGKFYAKVVAQDFVDGAKYVLTKANGSATSGILTSVINNSAEYFEGEITDFAQVGVEAVSEFQIKYTLYEPTPYFLSMLTYSPFLPVNAKYMENQGSEFGKTANNILVNGAFRITTHQFETKMIYTKNYHYFDRDHVYVKHVQRTYVPNTADTNITRLWYESGVVDGFTVNATDNDGWEKYVSGPDNSGSLKNPYHQNCNSSQSYGTSVYIGYWNFNRSTWEYGTGSKLSDGETAFTSKSDAQKLDTAKAVLNKDFRLGFMYGLKALEYLKRFSKDEPENYLMRMYTNRELTSYDGKDYCDFVDDVFNEKQGTEGKSLTGILNNGEDPVFDATKAAAHFATAKAALQAQGVTNFPVYVDIIQSMNAKLQPLEKAMYQAIEDASDGLLRIVYNLADTDAKDEEWGSETNNYDFSMWSGWGPDYADPNTYMHTFAKDGGDSLSYLGFTEESVGAIYAQASGCDTVEALKDLVLGEYDALYKAAAAITDVARTEERYEAFALAEYNLIFESGIIAPWMSQSGYFATVSNIIAWQAGRASYGLTSDKFKNVVVADEVMTKDLRNAVTAEYEAGKAE